MKTKNSLPHRTNNILLKVGYDGSRFSGWQRQKNKMTVQQTLEEALEALLKNPTVVTASGRTDAGVHARGQVVNFYAPGSRVPPASYAPALNRLLPPDIRIRESFSVPDSFHARKDALKRSYLYYLSPGVKPDLFSSKQSVALPFIPDIRRLNTLAVALLGEQDFSLFASSRDQNLSKIREVSEAVFLIRSPFIVFKITANAFLWHMVRSVIGTLLKWERDQKTPDSLKELIARKDKKSAGKTMPAHGLFLEKVFYHDFS